MGAKPSVFKKYCMLLVVKKFCFTLLAVKLHLKITEVLATIGFLVVTESNKYIFSPDLGGHPILPSGYTTEYIFVFLGWEGNHSLFSHWPSVTGTVVYPPTGSLAWHGPGGEHSIHMLSRTLGMWHTLL